MMEIKKRYNIKEDLGNNNNNLIMLKQKLNLFNAVQIEAKIFKKSKLKKSTSSLPYLPQINKDGLSQKKPQ